MLSSVQHLCAAADGALSSQGASLFYFTAFDSPQPRGIIPIENARISRPQRPEARTDRRNKYVIKVALDPAFEVKKSFYLLSARSRAGHDGWVAVRLRA
jgi:hypothetical protein